LRRLCRDYEELPENHEGAVYIAMIRLMLRRLTDSAAESEEGSSPRLILIYERSLKIITQSREEPKILLLRFNI
jgi:hypothetical protein